MSVDIIGNLKSSVGNLGKHLEIFLNVIYPWRHPNISVVGCKLLNILFHDEAYLGAYLYFKFILVSICWYFKLDDHTLLNILFYVGCRDYSYRDKWVERQRRWPEALFRRLATLHLSEFFPLTNFPVTNAQFAAFVFFKGF